MTGKQLPLEKMSAERLKKMRGELAARILEVEVMEERKKDDVREHNESIKVAKSVIHDIAQAIEEQDGNR